LHALTKNCNEISKNARWYSNIQKFRLENAVLCNNCQNRGGKLFHTDDIDDAAYEDCMTS